MARNYNAFDSMPLSHVLIWILPMFSMEKTFLYNLINFPEIRKTWLADNHERIGKPLFIKISKEGIVLPQMTFVRPYFSSDNME